MLTAPNPGPSDNPEHALLFTERDNIIRDALASLDPQQLRVVRGTHFDKLSRQDLATELGVSRHSISTIYRNAMNKLRLQLAANKEVFIE